MLIIDIYYIVKSINISDTSRLATFLILFPLLLLPLLIKNIFKIKISYEIEIIYLLFILFAQVFGSIVNLYSKVEWYDIFMHFLSGFLSALLGLILLVNFKNNPKKQLFFTISYILGIVFLIASFWEFYEFTIDQLTGSNIQHWKETGVEDTMMDFISAFIGSIIFIFFYLTESSKGIINSFIKNKNFTKLM